MPASKPGLSAGARDGGQRNRVSRELSAAAGAVLHGGKGPPAHPPEPAYPCCLPALGRFAGWAPHGGSTAESTGGLGCPPSGALRRTTRTGTHHSTHSADSVRRSLEGRQGRSARAVSSPAEDSPSGLGRTIGNRVGRDPSGVQIPYPPPVNLGLASGAARAATRRFGRGSQFGAQLPSKLRRRTLSLACGPLPASRARRGRRGGRGRLVCARRCRLPARGSARSGAAGEGRPRRDRADISGLAWCETVRR